MNFHWPLSFHRHSNGSPAKKISGGLFEVDNWTLSTFVLKKLIPVVGVHPFPLPELLLLSGALAWVKPTHVFDWGTHIGKSARVFYETSCYFRLRVDIHSIDLPNEGDHSEHPGRQRGVLVRRIPSVHLHLGDGVSTALKILQQSDQATCQPLFFLDGDHSYDSVRRELQAIWLVYPHAPILVHDTFEQVAASGYNTGPYHAVNDVLAKHPGQHLTVSTLTGLPGMTFIYPHPCGLK